VFTARYGLDIYIQFMKFFCLYRVSLLSLVIKLYDFFYMFMHSTITGNVAVGTDQSVFKVCGSVHLQSLESYNQLDATINRKIYCLVV
jgi:hypothetical protein